MGALRQVTREPGSHWFAYYDKLQFDPTDRFMLGMRVDFEDRSPRADDTIEVGMVDLEDGDRWIPLGTSSAWCWQQGCMLQWVPGTASTVLWNDRQADRYVCHLLDVATGERRTLDRPIYTLSPDGKSAFAPDFRRINDMRPGYGYAGFPDPHVDEDAPNDSGIWRINLATGRAELIFTLANARAIPFPHPTHQTSKHWFNHLLVNPDGSRLVFLNRWRVGGSWCTRMLTVSPDGRDPRPQLDESVGFISHFIWRDPHHILAYTQTPERGRGFYLVDERTAKPELVYACELDGHCSYLPGRTDWIVNDTYPQGPELRQELYLYHVPTGNRHPLASIRSRPFTNGEWRCDLHQRSNRAGTALGLDAFQGQTHRQMVLADIRDIVG